MRATVVTFPDSTSLGQAPVVRAPYLTGIQTVSQLRLLVAQQQQLSPYLRRLPVR